MSDVFAPAALAVSGMLFASIWEGAIVVAAVWLCMRCLPKLGASTRYAIWLSALVMLFVAPVATVVLSGSHQLPAIPTQVTAPVATRAESAHVRTSAEPEEASQFPWIQVAAPAPRHQRIDVPRALSLTIALLWLVAAGTRLAVLLANVRGLVTLRRSAEHLREAYGYAVLGSARVSVPLAIGFARPAVVLPETLARELSPEALDAIVMHEVAHLRRYDVWTNALSRILEAVLALNPVAWFVQARLSVEREIACDDWVVSRLDAGEIFATALATMACRPVFASLAAPSAIGSKHSVVARIERLLDKRPRRLRLSAAALSGALVLLAVFAMVVPTISPVLAFAPQGSTAVAAGCSDHGVMVLSINPETMKPMDRWVPLKSDPKQAGQSHSTILDVTVDANGKLGNVIVIRTPYPRDARAAERYLHNYIAGFRPATANCKAVTSTVRLALWIDIAAPQPLSIVSATYPNGWSEQHPGACRVPDLTHAGVPGVTLVNTTTLSAAARVDVDARGNATGVTITKSSGNEAYDRALLAAAKAGVYPLDESTGFKPVRPSGTTLAWNATHGYSQYSKCAPRPSEYTWNATFPPADR